MGGQVEKEYCRPFPYPTPPTALQGGQEEEGSRGGGTAWAAGTAFRPPACAARRQHAPPVRCCLPRRWWWRSSCTRRESAELGDAVTLRGEVRLNSSSCALACFPQVDACCGWSLHSAFFPYCYYNTDCEVYAPAKTTESEYEYAHGCRKWVKMFEVCD